MERTRIAAHRWRLIFFAAGAILAGWLLRGVLAAVAGTLAAVIVFAIIIGLTDLQDSAIRIINQLIKAGAIFLGVWVAVPRGSERAIGRGVLIGLVYMGVGVLLYALLSGYYVYVSTARSIPPYLYGIVG